MEPGYMTPRSKHHGVKCRWFRTSVKANEIEIDRVDTWLQKADILTKALRTKRFKNNQQLSCGWLGLCLAREGVLREGVSRIRQHIWSA
jgi:hypothetical protein